MFKLRFSFLSVTAMVLATMAITVAMMWFQGGGFAGRRGYPFAWYWWTDVSLNGSPMSGYRWLGLVADVIIWVAVVILFGLLVERTTQRFLRQHEHSTAT